MPKHNLEFVELVALEDADGLKTAFQSYGDSWCKRGGVGAFMMMARKWDRLEPACEKHDWNIFTAVENDPRAEGVIDDIRDLRRYLLLVEAELRARGIDAADSKHRDN